jgi:1,4-alpha-glucan branching enzyme
MPVENTHSFNWGYDGVDKFAPQNSFLGGPDKLKELIDYAHQKKLNVIMDIVPNHIGPDGNALAITGPYLDGDGPFGSYLNFERKDNKYVREYITNAAMLWLRDYHCDAIRADMTKFMKSDYTMKKISAEVNYHHRHAFLVAEDGRENDWRVTRPLTPEESIEGPIKHPIEAHCEYIEKINRDQVNLENLGFCSEWNFLLHHELAACLLGNWDNHPKNLSKLDAVIKSSPHRVQYFMSHDEIGNMDGTRLITKAVTNDLGMFSKVNGNSDSEKGQNAAQGTQILLKALLTGEADKMTPLEWVRFNQQNNIKETIPLNKLKESFKKATDKHKLALGQTFVTPGPKMLFQGDETGLINPFKFFREFSHPSAQEEMAIAKEKGYPSGKAALLDSKMTSINYSPEAQKTLGQIKTFTQKLAAIIDENPALKEGKIQDTMVYTGSDVYGMHRKEDANEIFTVSNFNDFGYDKNYYINFPKGKWQEILNSDAEEFGGSAKFANSAIIDSDNLSNKISLPGNSILVFKKI